MKRAAFAVPGSLDTPTGGYAYDKRIIDELRLLGWQIDVIDLGGTFPYANRAARAVALTKLLAVREGCPIVIDGLAYGAMADEAQMLRERNPLVALVHHPLALETGIDAVAAQALRESERAALGHARAVIVTSEPTAAIVTSDYAVPAERVTVVRPAVDRVRLRARTTHDDAVRLLAVGSITPRKGYDILLEALAALKEFPWRLTIAGDTTRSASASARLDADIVRLGLRDRVFILGAVTGDRLGDLYADADVFVLASLFEGYGMVFGEAIANGLPVVATAVGAAREIVPPEAAMLVAPGDANALREALRHVIMHADLRAQMAAAARRGAHSAPEWRYSASQFSDVIEALL